MKAGIHPNYKTVKVTCACGNTLKQDLLKMRSVLKLAPSAILSIQAVKSLLKLAGVLTASIRNTALSSNKTCYGLKTGKNQHRLPVFYFFFHGISRFLMGFKWVKNACNRTLLYIII